jgi:phosphoadenosine phosphosulfate reductase
MRMARFAENSPNACAPAGWWKLDEVFAVLASEGLPAHPSYAMLGGGRWDRRHLRVSEVGDEKGIGWGRREWEREYYGDVLRRLEAGK